MTIRDSELAYIYRICVYMTFTHVHVHTQQRRCVTVIIVAISCCGWPANVIITIIINIHHDALLMQFVGKLQGRIEVLITVYQAFENRSVR